MAELCEIRIDDASWIFDNNFAFVLKPTKDLPILVISENDPNKNPFKLAYDLEPVFNCKISATFNNSAFDANSLVVFNQSENVSKANFEALINYSKKELRFFCEFKSSNHTISSSKQRFLYIRFV